MSPSVRPLPARPRRWPALRAAVLLSLVPGWAALAPLPARALPPLPPESPRSAVDSVLDRDWLLGRLHETHVFLVERKHGLPYTPDARPLEPYSEVVRLLVDSQALGYLNLYRLTGQPLYAREAEERLSYIVGLGGRALAHRSFDGQVGYSLLLGAEVTGDSEFLAPGLRVAQYCRGAGDLVMNWGLLAALAMGEAFRLTGDERYRAACRTAARRTASRQFADGAFPHQADTSFGRNTHYTSWLLFEMLLHRRQDPLDPDLEIPLLEGTRFLARRVNPDGSLSYQDGGDSYWADSPGAVDSRGWLNELPLVTFDLLAAGRRAQAAQVLRFLFRHERGGRDLGGYPDKWGFADPASPSDTSVASVIRTSLVFWFLSEIALSTDTRGSGTVRPCTVSPQDCNAAFRELGQCGGRYPGVDVCLDGVFTGCLDEDAVGFVRCRDCEPHVQECLFDPRADLSEWTTCWHEGTRKRVGAAFSPCFDVIDEVAARCEENRASGDSCRRAGAEPAAARETAAGSSGFRYLGAVPNPARGVFALALTLDRSGPLVLEVLDVAGRLRAERHWAALPPGAHRLGLADGARLPAGVYVLRVHQGERTATARLVVVP